MFCSNCGTNNRDDADFCAECGARLTPASSNGFNALDPNAPNDGGAAGAPGKKMSKNKLIGLITIGAAALALIVLGIIFIPKLFSSSARSVDETVELYTKAACGDSSVDLLSLFPKDITDKILKEYDASRSKVKKEIKEMLDERQQEDKRKFKSVKITDFEKLDLDDFTEDAIDELEYYTYYLSSSVSDDLMEALREFYNDGVIDEARDVHFDMKYRQDGSNETDDYDLTLIKVGNSWYLQPYLLLSFLENLGYRP